MNRGVQGHAASHNYLKKGLKMQRALSKYPQHNCSKATFYHLLRVVYSTLKSVYTIKNLIIG